MHVKELMTSTPACCTPDTTLPDVAQLMADHDCGCIPVVEDQDGMKPVGVITDRDIALRGVTKGGDVNMMTAGDCMSSPVATVSQGDSVDDCCRVMEEHKVRRVVVVDENGSCCGMVAQADIALGAAESTTAHVVQEVSKPADGHASNG